MNSLSAENQQKIKQGMLLNIPETSLFVLYFDCFVIEKSRTHAHAYEIAAKRFKSEDLNLTIKAIERLENFLVLTPLCYKEFVFCSNTVI